MIWIAVHFDRATFDVCHQSLNHFASPLKIGGKKFRKPRHSAFGAHDESSNLFPVVAAPSQTTERERCAHHLNPSPTRDAFGELRSRLWKLASQKLLELGSLLKLVDTTKITLLMIDTGEAHRWHTAQFV